MTGESKYCVAASVMLNRTTKCAPLVALKTCRVITVLLTFLVNTEMSRELCACVRALLHPYQLPTVTEGGTQSCCCFQLLLPLRKIAKIFFLFEF